MRIPFSLSLAKTGTFAAVHFTVAFSVAYLLTGSLGIASAIALIEPAANTVAYLLHERAWARFMPGFHRFSTQTMTLQAAHSPAPQAG
jgi:uncharacterized membrane protein